MNIYVSNIPFKMGEEQLKELFAVYGEVSSCKIIMDKFTQRSRGFGFVEMPDDVATQAIEGLNDREVMGLSLRVSESKPKPEGSGGGYNKGGSGGGRNDYNKRRF